MVEIGEHRPYSLPEVEALCARLSDMLPSLPGIVYRCRNNERWTMLDLAEPVRELTGYGPEELIDDAEVAYADLIHEEDRDRVWDEIQEALDEGLPFRTSYRIRTRDGDVIRVWEQGRVAGGADDEIIGFIQDVTAWQDKWARLEHTIQLLQKTVSSLGEAVLVIDTTGEGRGILSVNPAAEEMFGYSEDELIGSTTERLHVSRESFERFAEELEPVLNQQGVVHASYPMKRKDGTEFAAEQTVTLLDPEEGLAGGAVSVIRDVSERHSLRQQLRQSQKLQAIGELAGGVAHDFNNILTVIRAHSDFALLELDEDHPLTAELAAIQEATDQATGLTNQLLAFGREQVLRPEVVDLNAVVRNMRRFLRRTIPEEIKIDTDLATEILPVEVDPGQLEQAIINLAVNARDAMPDGGTMSLATAVADRDPPDVQLTVTDTGAGMDEKTRARAFEPFYTTKQKGQGTGLGLASVYGFVTQTGGSIDVESAPGEGTTFTLRFPRSAKELTDQPSESAPAEEGPTAGRILLVEDDPNVQRVVRKTLERAGFTVQTADNGEEGLATLEAEGDAFDLILTDLVLPGVSGRKIVDRVVEDHLTVPVVVMSGYAEEEAEGGGTLPPEAEFIQKPFTTGAIVAKVREVLSRRG